MTNFMNGLLAEPPSWLWQLHSLTGLDMESTLMILLLVIGLMVGSVSVQWVSRRCGEKTRTELRQRMTSWYWMIGTLVVAALLGPWALGTLVAFLCFACLKEFITLTQSRSCDHRVLGWAFLAIPLQFYWISQGWLAMALLTIPVYLFLLIPVRLLFTGEPQGMIASMGKIHWALMAFVFCLSHWAMVWMLPDGKGLASGTALFLGLLLLTELNDVAQYVWGKTLGKHPIAPTISPKKTWEGCIGGILTTTLVGGVCAPLLGIALWMGCCMGAIIAIVGFFGDLVVSAIKRDIGVKDSSGAIPGHGGFMDRLDSMVYTAPFFFHCLNYWFSSVV